MEPLCLGKPGDPGRRGKDNRLFVEAVLWIARTDSPWRDPPPSFRHWNDWVKADIRALIADKAFDCTAIIAELEVRDGGKGANELSDGQAIRVAQLLLGPEDGSIAGFLADPSSGLT